MANMACESATIFVYDPMSPAFDADPHPTFAWLRDNAPVYFWEAAAIHVVSRYDDVMAVLKDRRFTTAPMMGIATEEPRTRAAEVFRDMLAFNFFTLDQASHLRIRRLVVPTFQPSAVEPLRERVVTIVAELLHGLGDRDVVDVVQDFATHVPVRVMSSLLGVHRQHEELFREFAQAMLTITSPWVTREVFDQHVEVFPAAVDMFLRLIEEKRAEPGDDLLSMLVQAHDEEDRLAPHELLGVVGSLITAGSETTVHLIGSAVRILLQHPSALAAVQADPSLLPGAISEVGRFDQFVKHGIVRVPREDVELRGITLPAGVPVVLLLASALRDPLGFADPDRFDIHRPPTNLPFGAGPHFCFGHTVARLETEVAVGELLRRYPRLGLDGPPVYEPHVVYRNLVSLPVRTGR